MSAWMDWIRDVALNRIDTVERDLTARDELWMSYTAALALEMYLAGARDGGRVHHAFVTGELPGREIQERKGEKWDDATDV